MAMKDLKITAAEQKKRDEGMKPIASSDHYTDRYPYGTELNLDNEILTKLGMKSLPKVGTKMMLEAECVVESVRESERMKGGKKAPPDRSVTIQIRKMELEPAAARSGLEAVEEGIEAAG